jgi:beta-lactamase regulating signal transducer with metallopeptidase domain
MNALIDLLTTDAARSTGWALIHLIWQGALIAFMVSVVLRLMQRSSASARYAVAVGGLALMLVVPVATTLYLYASGSTPGPAGWPPVSEVEVAVQVPAASTSAMVATTAAPGASLIDHARRAAEHALPWMLLAWLLGVVVLSARLAAGVLGTRRLCREASPASPEWLSRFESLRRRMRISRPIRLLESAMVDVPMVVGWLRPAVLVPVAALTGLPPQQLELILAHELAHIRRRDHLVNLLQTASEIVLFFHPAVWWLSEQVRVEREHCCDDLAVELCGSPLRYARALTELETLRLRGLQTALPAGALAASGGSLRGRVFRLLRPNAACPQHWAGSAPLLSVVVLLFVATPLAALAPLEADTRSSDPLVATTEEAHAFPAPVPQPRPAPSEGPPAMPGPVLALPDPVIDLDLPAPALPDHGEMRRPEAPPRPARPRAVPGGHQDTLDVEELIAMRIHRVTPEFIREMEALGFRGLSVQDLVAMRIHGVTPEFVRGMQAVGVDRLSHNQLVAMRIHGVTPEYVQAVRALGVAGVDQASHFVEMRIHRVTPEFIREMQAAGLGDLPRSMLVAMRIHGVTSEFVRGMEALGYRDLSHQQLLDMAIHRVTPEFIREMGVLGYRDLPVNQLVAMRIHRVTPELVRELREAGFADVTPDQLVRIRISGVDRELIESRRRARYGQ